MLLQLNLVPTYLFVGCIVAAYVFWRADKNNSFHYRETDYLALMLVVLWWPLFFLFLFWRPADETY